MHLIILVRQISYRSCDTRDS